MTDLAIDVYETGLVGMPRRAELMVERQLEGVEVVFVDAVPNLRGQVEQSLWSCFRSSGSHLRTASQHSSA